MQEQAEQGQGRVVKFRRRHVKRQQHREVQIMLPARQRLNPET